MCDHPPVCPDLRELARLLKAELGEEIVRLALRKERRRADRVHWMEVCDHCLGNLRTLEQWQNELDHPDLELVARERPRAWRLWESLESLPDSVLKRSLETHHLFWGMANKVMLESREALAISARRGILLAEIGVGMTELLADQYCPRQWADLRLKSWAFMGNALRVAGRLQRADQMFTNAATLLHQGTGRPMVRAQFCDLLGSLRKDQHRFQEAEEVLSEAADLYEQSGRPSLIGKIRLLQGDVADLDGQIEKAIDYLTEAQQVIDAGEDPVLYAHCQHHLVFFLVEVGQFDEAFLRLPMARRLWLQLGNYRNLAKLRWLEGKLFLRMGFCEEAEVAFEEAKTSMMSSDFILDHALLRLDQAGLFLEVDNLDGALGCAREACSVLSQVGDLRDVSAALGKASEDGYVTRELVAQVAAWVRRFQRQASMNHLMNRC